MSDVPVGSSLDMLRWSDARLWPQFEALHALTPDATALIDAAEQSWSRGEIFAAATAIAERLKASGTGAADRILLIARKTVGSVAAALAVSKLGAILCPISPSAGATDLAILETSLGHVATIIPEQGCAVAIEVRDPALRSRDPRDAEAVLIGFTSGTTGVPKAVIHAAEALNYVTRACAVNAGLGPDEAVLGIMPFDSAAGFTFTVHLAFSLGHPLVLMDGWNPVEAIHRARRFGCGWTTGVPTHLFTMIEAARAGEGDGRSPLRVFAVGGSAMTAELVADAKSWLGIDALRMFGMSECLAPCSNRPADAEDRRLAYDGVPYPHSEVAVFDSQATRLATGARGEAGVRGPSLFLGYAAGLGADQERMTSDGFYLTGDEVVVDSEGFVRVVGRIKDQIIRGGFNIDPAEVEALVSRHPSIAEVAIVAVPDVRLGERACIMARMRADQEEVDLAILLDHLDRLGLYRKKWPEYLVVVDRMILLPSGKVDKKAMAVLARQRLEAERADTTRPGR